LGFVVIELNNGSRFSFNENFFIEIYAADNCNPELCGKFFGCGALEANFGSTQIDSLAVFGDNDHIVVNLNDCPFELTKGTIKFVTNKYKKVDFLLVGYAGAGPFPQCFNMDKEVLQVAAINKQKSFINQAKDFIDLVRPNYYMPFAGTYVLGGKLACKNDYRGVPNIFRATMEIDNLIQSDSKSILLNAYQKFDLSRPLNSLEYMQIDELERENYINYYLANKKFNYENDAVPRLSDFLVLIPDAWSRFMSKANEIGYTSNTYVIIDLVDDYYLILNLGGFKY
jgi:UDP-MurNAc hydroxylase